MKINKALESTVLHRKAINTANEARLHRSFTSVWNHRYAMRRYNNFHGGQNCDLCAEGKNIPNIDDPNLETTNAS